MSLLGRTVEFAGALRQAGIPVSTAEAVDATEALGKVDLLDREQLRAALPRVVQARGAPADLRHPVRPVVPAELGDGVGDEEFDGRRGGGRRRADGRRRPLEGMRDELRACCSTATTRRCAGSPGRRSAASGAPTRRPGASRSSPIGCCGRCRRRR